MSDSLSYWSEARLSPERQTVLMQRVAGDVAAFRWWAESISLRPVERGLIGQTKLFLNCADIEEDSIMAWWNTVHVLRLLQGYARDFDLSWMIKIEDQNFGQLDGSSGDRAVFDAMDQLLGFAGVMADDPDLPDRIKQIDAKHANRWD